jgi:NADH:ubiquinone oxidoreductase subunit K
VTLHLSLCLYAAAALFSLGLYGVLSHRSVLSVLVSLQLLLSSGSLSLIAFARAFESSRPADPGAPQVLALIVIAVAAAQAAVGCALLFALFRRYRTLNLDGASRGD